MVAPGDDLAALIAAAIERTPGFPRLADGDTVVIAQKVVSKAENRYVALSDVTPSPEARDLARDVGKDPRLVAVILDESSRVLRRRPGVLIVVHRLGLVLANAGVDASNVGPDGDDRVLLLPHDPDASAGDLHRGLKAACGADVGVIVSDSPGRAWRRGSVNIAIGVAGLAAVVDRRGDADLFGRPLQSTVIGHADQIAAAAGPLQGQADEGTPVVLVRGLPPAGPAGCAADLIRDPAEDLFL